MGAGDCPHCGGDVVFDLHGEPVEQPDEAPRASRARALLRRLLRL